MDEYYAAEHYLRWPPLLCEEMREEIVRLRAENEDLDRWRVALEELTPGGSEYHRDLDRCVRAVRERLAREHARMLMAAKERNEARAENEAQAVEIERLQRWRATGCGKCKTMALDNPGALAAFVLGDESA